VPGGADRINFPSCKYRLIITRPRSSAAIWPYQRLRPNFVRRSTQSTSRSATPPGCSGSVQGTSGGGDPAAVVSPTPPGQTATLSPDRPLPSRRRAIVIRLLAMKAVTTNPDRTGRRPSDKVAKGSSGPPGFTCVPRRSSPSWRVPRQPLSPSARLPRKSAIGPLETRSARIFASAAVRQPRRPTAMSTASRPT